MSTNYAKHVSRRGPTPQNQPLPGQAGAAQVPNHAGGYVWTVDKWTQLQRFLILGAAGGTYYVGERELTRTNAVAVEACIAENPQRVLDTLLGISTAGLAAKQDPTIFALALYFAVATGDGAMQAGVEAFPKREAERGERRAARLRGGQKAADRGHC